MAYFDLFLRNGSYFISYKQGFKPVLREDGGEEEERKPNISNDENLRSKYRRFKEKSKKRRHECFRAI